MILRLILLPLLLQIHNIFFQMLSLGTLDIYFSSHSSYSKGSSKIIFNEGYGAEILVVAWVDDLTIAFLISY